MIADERLIAGRGEKTPQCGVSVYNHRFRWAAQLIAIQQLPDGWHQFCGNYHDSQAVLFKSGFSFRYGFIFSLRFVMPYHVLNPFIVPSWREIVGLFHLPLLLLRRRYAASALPSIRMQ